MDHNNIIAKKKSQHQIHFQTRGGFAKKKSTEKNFGIENNNIASQNAHYVMQYFVKKRRQKQNLL